MPETTATNTTGTTIETEYKGGDFTRNIGWFIAAVIVFLTIVVGFCMFVKYLKGRSVEAEEHNVNYAPAVAVAAPPAYPKVLHIPINRNGWSQPVTVEVYEHSEAKLYENVPLKLAVDGKAYDVAEGDTMAFDEPRRRQLSFMIGPGGDTSVTEASIECTITHR